MKNIENLAKKLKALAERGVGGERENAIDKLQSLCNKYGINMDFLDDEKPVDHEYWIDDTDLAVKFLVQVSASVCGHDFECRRYVYKGKRNPGKIRMCITCAPYLFVEIVAKYEFFMKHLDDELDIFYSAFIHKNKLFMNLRDSDDDSKQLTIEEKERMFRILGMMSGIKEKTLQKRINQ